MYDIDWDHVRSHEPKAADRQIHKLAMMPNKKLNEEYNEYLRKGEQTEVSSTASNRFRSGYLRPSKGYESGPRNTFKNFVRTL